MVQIIRERKKPTFSQELNAMGKEFFNELPTYMERLQFEKQNPDIAGLPAEFQKMAYDAKLKKEHESEKLKGEKNIEGEDYKKIENAFGKNFADIWKAAPTGGKTELLKMGLESKLRGQNIGQLFEEAGVQQNSQMFDSSEEEKLIPKKTERHIDFDKGLIPRERTARQDKRYEKNLPLFQELEKRRTGLENEKDALNILEELSPQISGIERLNINPSTGELILPVLASKEAQRFSKTINDFTTKAKDTYGARVTNFELDRFLKRLPNLANSEEGRREIIQQMKIINSINESRDNALNDVFEEYGGIRNIDYDQAERLAEKRSKSEIDKLKKEFSKIDASLDKRQDNIINERKKITPKGKVAVQKADGTSGYIDSDKVKAFLKIEGNKLL